MDLKKIIGKRRSYRSLEPVKITDSLIENISRAAGLMPSCYNKQPWRYVFVREKDVLNKLKETLSEGNEWAKEASMIIGVVSKKELDCVLKDGREYYNFDTGMSTGIMLLKLVEAGLVGHAIAGYDQEKAKDVLNIPSDMELITLIIVGKKS
ncbi:MAG: nitroreductase family protein, partial [Elusimicrobiota bacterium]